MVLKYLETSGPTFMTYLLAKSTSSTERALGLATVMMARDSNEHLKGRKFCLGYRDIDGDDDVVLNRFDMRGNRCSDFERRQGYGPDPYRHFQFDIILAEDTMKRDETDETHVKTKAAAAAAAAAAAVTTTGNDTEAKSVALTETHADNNTSLKLVGEALAASAANHKK
jgi:hypothetical protein